MLSAGGLPLLLEMSSVLIGARLHSHQDAAFANTSFILLGALLRDAPVAKCCDKAERHPSGARTRQCYGYGASGNPTQAGNRQKARGDNDRDDGAYCSSDGAAKFTALCCFTAQFGVDLTITGEVSFTRVIGHDQADVPRVIAPLNNGSVCAFDTLAVSE